VVEAPRTTSQEKGNIMAEVIYLDDNKYTRDKAHMLEKILRAIALKSMRNGNISKQVYEKKYKNLKLIP